MSFVLLWLRKSQYAIGAVAIIAGSLIGPINVFGQTRQYIVTEVSRGHNWGSMQAEYLGDIAGRAGSPIGDETRGAVRNHSNLGPKHLAALVSRRLFGD